MRSISELWRMRRPEPPSGGVSPKPDPQGDYQIDPLSDRAARQTIRNDRGVPIYIYIEPWPHCYELEQGETLKLIFEVPEKGDALDINFINERELVIWPNGSADPVILINGLSAEDRNWKFKHR